METRKTRIVRRTLWGLVLMALGILLLGENMGIIGYPISHIVFTWQMLLIVIGSIGFITKGINPASIILIAIGVFFLLPGVGEFFWPVILVAIGLSILFHNHDHGHWHQRCRAEWHQRHYHVCRSGWYSNTEHEQKIQNSSTD